MATSLDPIQQRKQKDGETPVQFESRKADHIRLSLDRKNQAEGLSGLQQVRLTHEALPDLNFDQVSLGVKSLGRKIATPFMVSSMTAGHSDSVNLNLRLAKACAERNWRMGVGSQRRELSDSNAAEEWKVIRKAAPKVSLLGNLGIAQLIQSSVMDVQRLVDALEAEAMIVHLNALQECLQPEGTPRFRGGLKAIEKICHRLKVPVVVKETGCGFSKATLKRLRGVGVAAVDVSGLGGTHWGRIEGGRSAERDMRARAAETLGNWGIPTVESLLNAQSAKVDYEIWASGGVRSGLDAAKLLAMGADVVGVAMPILDSALKGEEELRNTMATFEFELKTALFCTGSATIADLQDKKAWSWQAT